MLVDEVSLGNRVEWDRLRKIRKIYYELSHSGRERLLFAAERALEVLFAAGASKAFLPSDEELEGFGPPLFTNSDQIRHVRKLCFVPQQTTLTSAHPQATVKMSEIPTKGYVNSRCEAHYVKNLLVCDSSSFPGSCGANPMVSIMTHARYQGIRIAGEMRRYFDHA